MAGTASETCSQQLRPTLLGLSGPSVAYIQPNQGPPGTTVVLWGGGFTTAQAVYFGPTAGTNLNVVSDTELLVAAPQETGTVNVTVRSAYGASLPVPKGQFTYVSPPLPPALAPVITPHGSFGLIVPPGTSSAPTVTKSCVAPANIPAHMTAVSCLYYLSGPALSPPGTLTLRYNSADLGGLSPDLLSVYALTGAAGWTPVATQVYATQAAVTATASGPEVLVLLLEQQQFRDLASAPWAQPSVDALLAAGVVGGFPNGTFQPNAPLTRAQFVKMLVLAKGLPLGSGQTAFTDVPPGSWFAPYVSAAVHAQLVYGLSATAFGPNQPVTREEMAVLLARAIGLTGTTPLRVMDVDQIDAWALPSVEAAVAAGYLHGFPNGTFQPLGPTTRAQAAVVLARVLAHQG